MRPRVILITDEQSQAAELVWNALDSRQCWIITPPLNKLWLLEEQLKLAHAVIIIVDKWLVPKHEELQFRRFIQTIEKYQQERPELQSFALVDQNVELRIPLTGFITITFVQAPSADVLEQVVESIREDQFQSTSDTGPKLAELLEDAEFQHERLVLIASRSTVLPIVGLVAAATIAGLGLALSIPRVLSRWQLSDAWLSIGPVLFVGGALTAIYLFSKQRREGEKRQMARFLAERLKKVIEKTYSTREPVEPTINRKDI